MNEAFLWYLWKYRLYHHDLITLSGESVIVESPGSQNSDSGPDFFNARIRIGETLWAGNVEVHTSASHWLRHKHHLDKAFDSVILHVVYEADEMVARSNGDEIPVVELKNFIDVERWREYENLTVADHSIPCAKQLDSVDSFSIMQWLDRTLVTRLERKSAAVAALLSQNNGSWEEAFYCQLAANFGFKINHIPFAMLASSLPLIHLMKHKSLFQHEALLFGQAGLLHGAFRESYPRKLKKEYIYLRKKLQLSPPIEAHLWKMSRLRPVNFPFVRIAQFAKLFCSNEPLLSFMLQAEDVESIKLKLHVEADDYWRTHYRFDRKSHACSKQLGSDAVENIIINSVVPFVFHYGRVRGIQRLCDKAVRWLEGCRPENNTIIRQWKRIGINASTAFHSQALIELKNEYCSRKNCLICGIGLKLLKTGDQHCRANKSMV